MDAKNQQMFTEMSKKFKEKMGDIKCPHCNIPKHMNDSITSMPIVESKEFHNRSHHLAVPFITLTCRNCGHADFYNPKILGIL